MKIASCVAGGVSSERLSAPSLQKGEVNCQTSRRDWAKQKDDRGSGRASQFIVSWRIIGLQLGGCHFVAFLALFCDWDSFFRIFEAGVGPHLSDLSSPPSISREKRRSEGIIAQRFARSGKKGDP
jgi:hypothetical protein